MGVGDFRRTSVPSLKILVLNLPIGKNNSRVLGKVLCPHSSSLEERSVLHLGWGGVGWGLSSGYLVMPLVLLDVLIWVDFLGQLFTCH